MNGLGAIAGARSFKAKPRFIVGLSRRACHVLLHDHPDQRRMALAAGPRIAEPAGAHSYGYRLELMRQPGFAFSGGILLTDDCGVVSSQQSRGYCNLHT
jgi:hypothetical protein